MVAFFMAAVITVIGYKPSSAPDIIRILRQEYTPKNVYAIQGLLEVETFPI